MPDEPNVYRIWTPKGNSYTPGLAVSRALGDHYMKDFGLISVPEVSHRIITKLDQFLIVATDGVRRSHFIPKKKIEYLKNVNYL